MGKIIMLIIILSFLLMVGSNLDITAQDFTDREMLIQLIEKFGHFEKALEEIKINSDIVRREIISIDKRIYKNSIEISNLSERYDATIVRWNALL